MLQDSRAKSSEQEASDIVKSGVDIIDGRCHLSFTGSYTISCKGMQCHVPADGLPSAPACRRCQVHFLWHAARCSKLRSSPWPCGQRYSLHKTKISSDLCLVCFIATFSHLHDSSQYSLYLKI